MRRSVARLLTVASRDFKHTVLTKAFLFAVMGVPLMVVVIGAVAVLIMVRHEEPPLIGTIGVVDSSGELVEALRRELDAEAHREIPPGEIARAGGAMFESGSIAAPGSPLRGAVELEVIGLDGNPGEPLSTETRERVRHGELLAAASVPAALLAVPEAGGGVEREDDEPELALLVGEHLDGDHIDLIERALGAAVVRLRTERAELDVDRTRALLDRPHTDTRKALAGGGESSEDEGVRALKRSVIPMVFMMLLWGSTFFSGQHLMMSTIDEKSNRVMEVLLSAVSPLELMAGKILGQGLVGLIVVGVYSSVGLAGLVVATQFDLVKPSQLLLFGAYFLMAYFMVATLMAAIGSAVTDIREANSLMTPVMIILMFPLMLWMPISQAPNGAVATTFSFIPPATPFVMILRVTADESVPFWQIPATLAWGTLCAAAMVVLAARVFRVGVLMTGKPPSPMELARWVRYR